MQDPRIFTQDQIIVERPFTSNSKRSVGENLAARAQRRAKRSIGLSAGGGVGAADRGAAFAVEGGGIDLAGWVGHAERLRVRETDARNGCVCQFSDVSSCSELLVGWQNKLTGTHS